MAKVKDLVGEMVTVECTDGNRVSKATVAYGELEEIDTNNQGVRLKTSEHGSTIHYFVPFHNMVWMYMKERDEDKAKGKGKGKAEEAEE